MKMKRCIALILTLAMALSCVAISASAVSIEDNTNTENNQVSTAAIDYGTVTQNSDGSVMLNFGQDSITVKGNRGDIVTDSEHGGILRPDNLRTNDDSIAILTLPSVNLKNSGYDKLDLYVASEKNAAVVVKAGDTEIASISNINTSGWETFNVFTQTLTTTDAEGLITLNITGEGANTYCGNYIYVKLYNSQAATATPKPTTDPNLPTATPAPTTDPNQETPIYLDTNYTFEERAADLVSRMTLQEKVSQIGYKASEIPRLGVSSYNYWREALHGVARQGKATSFPSPLSMSNTWNRDLVFQVADATSTEARAKNPNTDLSYWSPTVNMARDPRWGRNEESYGEDPYLTGQLGIQFVNGMQGDDEKYL
ncbi:MAG: glycoside hydrolase family 3 N-terminal domain-containing protein, partial [Monoglobus pectinilyticus]